MVFCVVRKYSDLDLAFLRKCFKLNLSDTSALFCAPRQNVIFALYLSIFSFEAIFLVPVEASWRKKYDVLGGKVVKKYIFFYVKKNSIGTRCIGSKYMFCEDWSSLCVSFLNLREWISNSFVLYFSTSYCNICSESLLRQHFLSLLSVLGFMQTLFPLAALANCHYYYHWAAIVSVLSLLLLQYTSTLLLQPCKNCEWPPILLQYVHCPPVPTLTL